MNPPFGSRGAFDRAAALVEGVDHVATAMERAWGINGLRPLVDDLLRERFDRQLRKFNDAVWGTDLEQLEAQAAGMKRAWRALDAAARAAGHTPQPPTVIEAEADGVVFAIVPDTATASRVNRQGRAVIVYTADEVARMLAPLKLVNQIKDAFPGAEIAAQRVRRLPEPDWERGDDLPMLAG